MVIEAIMAVQGAHLTSTVAEEGDAPSIFEVLAQDSLVHAPRPALRHLLRVFAEKNPGRYGLLYAYTDEVYLALQLVLERYYLKHYSSSFSENFYGMKRVAVSCDATNDTDGASDVSRSSTGTESDQEQSTTSSTLYHSLPKSNMYKSLLFLVFVPYLKNKCDEYYEKLSSNTRSSIPQTEQNTLHLKKRLCRAFLAVYPILHMVWESTMLGCQLAYVFEKSRVHSPFLRWAGVILQNLTEEDLQGEVNAEPFNLQNKTWSERAALVSNKLLSVLAVTLSSGLSVGVFFLQFLEWWYASDQKAVSLTALPNPPAPEVLVADSVPTLHTLCPLCHRVRTNDTALAVSGHVFCYSCVSRYVAENSCCPVTKYPATSNHLVRLYLPDS